MFRRGKNITELPLKYGIVVGPALSLLATWDSFSTMRWLTGTIVLVYLQLLCCPACMRDHPVGRRERIVAVCFDFSIATSLAVTSTTYSCTACTRSVDLGSSYPHQEDRQQSRSQDLIAASLDQCPRAARLEGCEVLQRLI